MLSCRYSLFKRPWFSFVMSSPNLTSGMIIFSYLTDFSYFSLKILFTNVAGHGQNKLKVTILNGSVDGFSYLSLISVILFSNQNHSCNFQCLINLPLFASILRNFIRMGLGLPSFPGIRCIATISDGWIGKLTLSLNTRSRLFFREVFEFDRV